MREREMGRGTGEERRGKDILGGRKEMRRGKGNRKGRGEREMRRRK